DLRALGSPLVAAKTHAVSLVPNSVPVAASNQLAGHLSARRFIYTFPYVGRARWVIADVNDGTYGDAAGYRRATRKYERSKAWRSRRLRRRSRRSRELPDGRSTRPD